MERRSPTDGAADGVGELEVDSYPDLVELNANRTLLDSFGRALLERTVAGHLAVLQTAITVFEANGDYATGLRPKGWCAAMDDLSRPDVADAELGQAIETGRWSCRSSCRRPALDAMAQGTPVESHCGGGLRIHAVPIVAGDTVVGSISVGLGDPPTEPGALASLAKTLGTTVQELERSASAATPSSPDTQAMACASIDALAGLLGEMFVRRSDELKRDRAREMSIGMLAHDLRNPISVIIAGTAAFQKITDQYVPDSRITARVLRSAKSMSRMVEDLLDFTRASRSGGMHLDIASADLGVVCAEAIDEVRQAHPARTIRFETSGDTVLACDAERLHRVLENLLVNAIRYGQGSSVEASAVGSSDGVRLSVHNEGPPIPAAALPTIFDAFARASVFRRDLASEGLGLGLHIAREIVSAHGGSIGVESTEARGTTFTVDLPRRVGASAAVPQGCDGAGPNVS